MCIIQDNTLKSQLHSFLMSSSSQQDVTTLDTKVSNIIVNVLVRVGLCAMCLVYLGFLLSFLLRVMSNIACYAHAHVFPCIIVGVHMYMFVCHISMQIHETVEQINAIKLQREFYLGFSHNPQVPIFTCNHTPNYVRGVVWEWLMKSVSSAEVYQ